VVTRHQLRTAADHLHRHGELSERSSARLLGCSRSSLRYTPKQREDEPRLIAAIRRLARRHPVYGYRFIHARLKKQGWEVNRKRVRRLWRALGLQKPSRPRNPKRKGIFRGASANRCVNRPARGKGEVWTCDFIADRTISGGSLKWLTVVDEYTREFLGFRVADQLGGQEVRAALAVLFGRRGEPRLIRRDNGSEFVCRAVTEWLSGTEAEGIQVAPGRPWENGYIESFPSRFRAEFLDRETFESVRDARAKGRLWRAEYNRVRPHSGLNYRTPEEFSRECDNKQS
jgi:putative transposase